MSFAFKPSAVKPFALLRTTYSSVTLVLHLCYICCCSVSTLVLQWGYICGTVLSHYSYISVAVVFKLSTVAYHLLLLESNGYSVTRCYFPSSFSFQVMLYVCMLLSHKRTLTQTDARMHICTHI
jgi:hypothetical protein